MVNWLLIGIAVLAIIVVSKFIHFRHIKHKITAIFLILLLLFLYSTFVTVSKNNAINLKSPSGLLYAGKVYFSWIGHIFGNVRVLTGNAVRMNWVGNSTG